MSDPTRKWTSLMYFGSMIGVLVSALILKIAVLVLVFLIVEVAAYLWYITSYIPYARDCIKNTMKKCI